jgi:hypothetical protein
MKRERDTPDERLHNAIQDGDAEAVQLLLRDPTLDPEHICVVRAAKHGSAKILRSLLHDPRIDPRAHEEDLVEWVLRKGSVKILRTLVEDGRVDFSSDYDYCNIVAPADHGRPHIVRALLTDPRVDPSYEDNAAFRCAAKRGHLEIVQILLADPRVDPSAYHNEPIRFAAYAGHEEIVRILLADPRVDPSDKDNYAAEWAARRGHAKILRMLLDDPRVNGFSSIHMAKRSCLGVLAADSRYGIIQSRDLYSRHHPSYVFTYDVMVARCIAMAWVAKQLLPWQDMVQPMTERWRAGFFE